MVRRIDHRVRWWVAAGATFLGGWALLFIIYGDLLPASIAATPPAIFAAMLVILAMLNAAHVRDARRALTHGEAIKPTQLGWVVWPFLPTSRPADRVTVYVNGNVVGTITANLNLRRSYLPVGGPGLPGQVIDITLLDAYRDWNPRQGRTIVMSVGNDQARKSIQIPANVSAADLRGGLLFSEYYFCVPQVGVFFASVEIQPPEIE